MCPCKWSDQAIGRVEDDRLHFSDYAIGISEVIKADSSPLTIEIYGSWVRQVWSHVISKIFIG